MLTVCVVIPAYNAESYISAALDSVAAQTRRPDQIIVVDDGSADGTVERVERWIRGATIPVDLIRRPNRGVAAARNVAIRHARTDLVAFLDADDLYLPGHLAAVVPALERDQGIVLCYADGELFEGRETIRQSLLYGTRVTSLPYDEYDDGLRVFRDSAYTSLLSGNYIPVSGTAFRRLQAEVVGLFDESLVVAEDREFFMRMSRKGRFAYVPRATHLKRRHGTNLTHERNTARNMRHQFLALIKPLAAARSLSLSPEEVAQTRDALRRHTWSLLYEASRRGIRAYADAARFVIGYGVVGPAFTPRHIARALVYSVKDSEPS